MKYINRWKGSMPSQTLIDFNIHKGIHNEVPSISTYSKESRMKEILLTHHSLNPALVLFFLSCQLTSSSIPPSHLIPSWWEPTTVELKFINITYFTNHGSSRLHLSTSTNSTYKKTHNTTSPYSLIQRSAMERKQPYGVQYNPNENFDRKVLHCKFMCSK